MSRTTPKVPAQIPSDPSHKVSELSEWMKLMESAHFKEIEEKMVAQLGLPPSLFKEVPPGESKLPTIVKLTSTPYGPPSKHFPPNWLTQSKAYSQLYMPKPSQLKLLHGIGGVDWVEKPLPSAQESLQQVLDDTLVNAPYVGVGAVSPDVKPYHTKGKDDWGTPQALYDRLNDEFGFTVDMAADEETAKCPVWIGPEIDALKINWWGRVFLNPPFSRTDEFLDKLIREMIAGAIDLAVAVVADRPDTEWMFQASCHAGEIRHLKGRVTYTLYPTPWQRAACEVLQNITIEDTSWSPLIKVLQLPKSAILQLRKDPATPGGSPLLTSTAPFPSQVLIFDKRKTQTTVYWDWKKKLKTVYGWSKAGVSLQHKIKQIAGQQAAAFIAPGWTESEGPQGLTILSPLVPTPDSGPAWDVVPPIADTSSVPDTVESFFGGKD
jgi:phage N-6-adenine-methyltransferase